MPRGIKFCPKCNTGTGPRAFVCPKCNSPFSIKGVSEAKVQDKVKSVIKLNWKELSRQDVIKVLSGSGPYWPLQNGEKEPMGYRGIFKVQRLTKDGILAVPVKSRDAGFCHIYMGPKGLSKTGLMLRPHKLRRLTRKDNVR